MPHVNDSVPDLQTARPRLLTASTHSVTCDGAAGSVK